MVRSALCLALLLAGAPAFAGDLAVAVLPFKDLAGSNKPVGEAIRQSVTTDLRGAPGIRVVERSDVERVLAEQKLQAAEMDDDLVGTLRLGKLIGADLITLGAYQQSGQKIRLTARFVRIETGEVVGTAKVDGDVSDFLSLQDRVTVELLKSAKLAPQVVERFARRSRPKLRNLRPVELYGRASAEKDDGAKRELLVAAVKEAPDFTYATDDLAALEARLREYQARADAAQKDKLAEFRKGKGQAKTMMERFSYGAQLGGQLQMMRRHHEALQLWRELGEELAASGDPAVAQYIPMTQSSAVQLLVALHRYDEALKEGEQFLKRYPDTLYFSMVKMAVEGVIERRRKIEAGKADAAKEAKEVDGDRRWDLCQLAQVYHRNAQYPEARRLFEGCLAAGTQQRQTTLLMLVTTCIELADWKAARAYLATLEKDFPAFYQQMKGINFQVPIDG